MRFMMLVKAAENSGSPPKALMDAIGKMAEEHPLQQRSDPKELS
jgi:hypothetical protein